MASGPPSAHAVLTSACGLVDRSARGKLALTGGEGAGLLSGQVTNDVETLADGAGCYAALLTNKGKMLGDLRVLRIGDELHLDCERACLQALFDQLRRASIGWDAELHKRTIQEGLFSLLGPGARRVAGVAQLPAEEHGHVPLVLGGAMARAIATDLGVDILCAAEDAETVEAALIEAGAEPVPEQAAEVVRVAAGRPRYGVDLDESVIPQEADLNDRAVSFTKGCYVGQETVARLHWRGKPNRHLRGVRLSAEVDDGTPLVGESGKVVGTLSSVVEHPEHGWIALALVRREVEPGGTVTLGEPGVELPAPATGTVVALPFA